MSDVKWIKIATDIFDDEKILLIESLPDSDAIIICWFKLLCLAGKQNNSGVFLINDRIPYTAKMLATIFRRKERTVKMALKVFEDFGMIEIINGAITIPKWEKHQNIDGLEAIREQTRSRVAKHREKQKAHLLNECNATSNATSNDNVTQCNALDKTRLDKTRSDNILFPNGNNCRTVVQSDIETVVNAWNQNGINAIKKLGNGTKRYDSLKARLTEYGLDAVLKAIDNISYSNFLKGQNKSGWTITFDWFVKPNNFYKVYEGNYSDKSTKKEDSGNTFINLADKMGW